MKRALFWLIGILSLFFFIKPLVWPKNPLPSLRIFTWASYFDSDVVRAFEKEYHCQVIFDIFDSNELMYAKLKSGREDYDLITPSLYMGRLMEKQGMILPLDWSKLPHLKSLDATYCKRREYEPYFVPYLITFTGIGYLKSRVDVSSNSWQILADPKLRWRTTLLNDYRETLAVGLMMQQADPNEASETELQQATELLLSWKPMIAKFENEQYKLGLDSAEFLAVHAYNGDIAQVMDENPDVDFLLPKEGFTMSVDVFCLHPSNQNKELAHAFIDFMHRPEIAAQNMTHTHYLCPNEASYALLAPSIRNNRAIFASKQEMQRCHDLVPIDDRQASFLEAWELLKSD